MRAFKPLKERNFVELFREVNIDWLGKKWYFLGFSLIFSVAGVLSLLFWHHLRWTWIFAAARWCA